MKILLLLIVLLPNTTQLPAQQIAVDSNSFYFRNQLHLQTPPVFLNAARLKAEAGDTVSTVHYIIRAAIAGLSDTLLITGDNGFHFITQRKEWKQIREIILNNNTVPGLSSVKQGIESSLPTSSTVNNTDNGDYPLTVNAAFLPVHTTHSLSVRAGKIALPVSYSTIVSPVKR